MKTNTIKVILSAATFGAVAMAATAKTAASYADLMALGVGYTAVGILIALAAMDYRGNVKDYAGR